MLTDDERKALVSNKVRRAHETWTETVGIIESGYWYAAANRMYYACYYMASALLLKSGYITHTHSGIIGLLGLHFVKTGILSAELGRFYSQLFELRQTGDYDEWRVIAECDILPLVSTAKTFLDNLEDLICKDGYLG